jgi:hypothetical protein
MPGTFWQKIAARARIYAGFCFLVVQRLATLGNGKQVVFAGITHGIGSLVHNPPGQYHCGVIPVCMVLNQAK